MQHLVFKCLPMKIILLKMLFSLFLCSSVHNRQRQYNKTIWVDTAPPAHLQMLWIKQSPSLSLSLKFYRIKSVQDSTMDYRKKSGTTIASQRRHYHAACSCPWGSKCGAWWRRPMQSLRMSMVLALCPSDSWTCPSQLPLQLCRRPVNTPSIIDCEVLDLSLVI